MEEIAAVATEAEAAEVMEAEVVEVAVIKTKAPEKPEVFVPSERPKEALMSDAGKEQEQGCNTAKPVETRLSDFGAKFPALGAGMGFRPPYRSDLFFHRPKIGFLEITIEHYLDMTAEKEEELDLLSRHFSLIPHGLNLSIGSAEGIDPWYLDEVAGLLERLRPAWWSEHLSWNRAGGVEIGHLSPLPFSQASVDIVCRNLEAVRKVIDRPFLLEQISYIACLPQAEMSEAAFLSTILLESGCGLLLDVTNLYANSQNHKYDPLAFLEALPPDRIVQMHFVGGAWQKGRYIDSHSTATPPEVWALFEEVCRRFPVKAASLERDEALPPFSSILEEIEKAKALGRRYHRW